MPNLSIFDLTGEVALVTGGASGIGRAIARRLDEAGAKVVVVDRNPDTAKMLTEHVPLAATVIADVSEPHVHAEIVRQASEPFGTPTILVNDAGVFPTVEILDATPEFFDEIYNTNLRGLALMTVAFSKAVIAAGITKSSVINIASLDGLKPSFPVGLAPYSASKGGVISLTRHLALELAPHGIAVNAIAPGTVLSDGVINAFGSREVILTQFASTIERIPVKRLAEPDDIAKVALFLASDAAGYMRGQTVVVDGGYSLN